MAIPDRIFAAQARQGGFTSVQLPRVLFVGDFPGRTLVFRPDPVGTPVFYAADSGGAEEQSIAATYRVVCGDPRFADWPPEFSTYYESTSEPFVPEVGSPPYTGAAYFRSPWLALSPNVNPAVQGQDTTTSVFLTDTSDFAGESRSFTLEAWMRVFPAALPSSGNLIESEVRCGEASLLLRVSRSGSDFTSSAGGRAPAGVDPVSVSGSSWADTWRHLAIYCNLDTGAFRRYVDGAKVADVVSPGWMVNPAQPGNLSVRGRFISDPFTPLPSSAGGAVHFARFTEGDRYQGLDAFTPPQL